ncbi:MAG: hypothetical protein JNG88_08480 [Phycisphaerales bacterium]|nr:hypothetical protein [Phycisphaerales bacterium]
MQCDGLVNNFDLDPFVERVSAGCCSDACPCSGACGGGEAAGLGGGAPSASATAQLLSDGVSPHWRANLEYAIIGLAATHPEGERREFWSDVLREWGARRR